MASDEVGVRFDRWLADRLGVSRARVRHLLESGRVQGPGGALRLSDKSRPTQPGERFEVEGALRAKDERPVARPDLPLDVVARGEGWWVVDKPAGRGVHPLEPAQQDTVLNAVVAHAPEIVGVGEGGLRSGVVHRLDVETSGALVFATQAEQWRRLRGAFSDHRVEKRYVAIVGGRFARERRVDLSLSVERHRPARVAVDPGGRACGQHVRPLLELGDAGEATLVEVKLETGFLHQIRASMAHLGHPLLGDPAYGGRTVVGDHPVPRVMLHARRLVWGEIDVAVTEPPDFAATLQALGASAG